MTKKFLQRSHLVLLQVKQPANGNVIDSGEPFLHLEGARISLRFLDLRKDEIKEFGGKSSLSFGDESKKGDMYKYKERLRLYKRWPCSTYILNRASHEI